MIHDTLSEHEGVGCYGVSTTRQCNCSSMRNERRSTYSVPKIYKGNFREALFAQSVPESKGLDAIRQDRLRLLRRWCADNIITHIQGRMRMGYRLHAWNMAMGMLLCKQSKLSGPIAKARLDTTLLNCVTKVVNTGYDLDQISMRKKCNLLCRVSWLQPD